MQGRIKVLKRNPKEVFKFRFEEEPNAEYILTGEDAKVYAKSHKEASDEANYWTDYYEGHGPLTSVVVREAWHKHNKRMEDYIKKEEKDNNIIDYDF